jgi:hypothetical protein
MVTLDYDKIAAALKVFETPIPIVEGSWVIMDGVHYVFNNGEWVEKDTNDMD